MEKLIIITMTLMMIALTSATVDALSIDTRSNIETILKNK